MKTDSLCQGRGGNALWYISPETLLEPYSRPSLKLDSVGGGSNLGHRHGSCKQHEPA